MTGPTGLVNFFVLEATDYAGQLDALLRAAGPAGPDADALTRAARALRGTATMARQSGISALAAAIERLGRALREGVLPWTPAMAEALTASVAELGGLIHAAHAWTDADDERAHTRTAELLALAPPSTRNVTSTPIVAAASGTMFVVSGATDVAAAFTAAASRPGNQELLAEALRRLRSFRGVAALRDHARMARTLDSVERVARHVSGEGRLPTATEAAVFATGARHLRRLAEDIRAGARTDDADTPEARAFLEAETQHERAHDEVERVVPISALYHDDDGPHLIREAAEPGTTATERFRLESAAAAEHLRRMVGDLRRSQEATGAPTHPGGTGGATVDDAAAGFAAAASALTELALSYGHDALAGALELAFVKTDASPRLAMSTADAVAALFMTQGRSLEELERRCAELASGRVLGTVVDVGYARIDSASLTPATPPAAIATPTTATPSVPASPASAVPTPAVPVASIPAPATPTPAASTAAISDPTADAGVAANPSGRELHAILASSIAGIERMATPASGADTTPAAELPASTGDGVVDVGLLLYRGRAALGRALELRDEIRRQPGTPSPEMLDELFDLLDLAATA